MIAAEGCIAGALHWFERALAEAPEPTRSAMVTALSSRREPALKALGSAFGLNAGCALRTEAA